MDICEAIEMNRITIWKKDGRYFGEIPEFTLLASDDDPGELVRMLESEVAKLSESYRIAGKQLLSPDPQREGRGRFTKPLAFFAAKTGIVAIAASIVIVVAIDSLSDRVRDGFFGGALGPFHLINVVGTRLENMPPHVKEKNLKDIERAVRELGPYMERLRPLILSDGDMK